MFLLLIGIVIFFAFLLIAYLFFMPNSNKNGENSESSVVDENTLPEPEKALDIISLKGKTPYKGTYFSFVFDDSEGIFYVYIDPANQEAGSAEFNEFLSQNGIPDKSSFPGLEEVSYPVPTPLP